MADAKISALPVGSVGTDDATVIIDAGNSRQATLGNIQVVLSHVNTRATIAGTARIIVEGANHWLITDDDVGGPLKLGEPRTIDIPMVIPNGYDYDAQNRAIIASAGRLSILGSGRLSIDQIDFRRSRLTLNGVG